MWEINSYNQAITFLLSICLGAVFCVWYDIIRALRKTALYSDVAIFITDVVTCFFYAVITFVFLISRTNGEIRGYVLAGEAIGFVLIRVSISFWLYLFWSYLFSKITLVKRALQLKFYNIYNKLENMVVKIVKLASKSAKKLLKNTIRLLYNDTNIADMEKTLDETENQA